MFLLVCHKSLFSYELFQVEYVNLHEIHII